MSISNYHQKYQDQSNERITHKLEIKKQELLSIFKEISFEPSNSPLRIAILGCGDRRFVTGHKRIFEELLKQPIDLTTFDITVEHLDGEQGVVQHDCTKALPNAPFDITYAHVLLKFIHPDDQFALIKNSLDALNHGGIAIHVLDDEEIDNKSPHLKDNLWPVPLSQHKEVLISQQVSFKEISLEYGTALVLIQQ